MIDLSNGISFILGELTDGAGHAKHQCKAATSTFLILTCLSFIDVIGGFTITIRTGVSNIASRVYSTCAHLVPIPGKPEIGGRPIFRDGRYAMNVFVGAHVLAPSSR